MLTIATTSNFFKYTHIYFINNHWCFEKKFMEKLFSYQKAESLAKWVTCHIKVFTDYLVMDFIKAICFM